MDRKLTLIKTNIIFKKYLNKYMENPIDKIRTPIYSDNLEVDNDRYDVRTQCSHIL